jgi:hypothetical protein
MRYLHRLPSDFETLESAVQGAGSALACPFASSAEFEAATINDRRAAGRYGQKRLRRQAFLIAVGIAAAMLLISLLP